ncbi:CoxG family protein [Bradyrhizobium sp. USDA 4504]
MPASPDDTWRFVSDLPSVLQCIPGVRVGDPLGEGGYSALIVASAGDYTVTFSGVASIEIGADRTATIVAKGSDAAGMLSAEAEVRGQVVGASDARVSVLDIQARFEFSGVFALAARASAGPAVAFLLRKFGANVAAAAVPSTASDGDGAVQDANSRTDEPDAGPQHRTQGRTDHALVAWVPRLFRKLRDGLGVVRS